MNRSRSRLIAVVLFLAIASALFFTGPQLWRWATTERVHTCIEHFAGWETVNRFTGRNHGEVRYWDLQTGVLVSRGWRTKERDDWTFFSPEGTLATPRALEGLPEDHPLRTWDGVATAPWMEEGLSYQEWYDARYSEPCRCLAGGL